MKNIKSLGQHWLKDRAILDAMVDFASVTNQDVVLEIGPGLGTLTSALLRKAKQVIAVEFDANLAANLPQQFPGKNLEVIAADFLNFDLGTLPPNYKVVANLPYYITSKIIRKLLESANRPQTITILVQKEVAERLAQVHGGSVLGLAVENWATCQLGEIVPAALFTPPPQVDSQIIRLNVRSQPLAVQDQQLMQVIKAGFSAKRKKLRSSLAGGLGVSKSQIEDWLNSVNLSPDQRAEELSFSDWQKLSNRIQSTD